MNRFQDKRHITRNLEWHIWNNTCIEKYLVILVSRDIHQSRHVHKLQIDMYINFRDILLSLWYPQHITLRFIIKKRNGTLLSYICWSLDFSWTRECHLHILGGVWFDGMILRDLNFSGRIWNSNHPVGISKSYVCGISMNFKYRKSSKPTWEWNGLQFQIQSNPTKQTGP